MRVMMIVAAFVLLGGAGQVAPPPESAGGQAPSFRSSVQMLEVDARVADAAGRFAADLSIDDFEIFEDGLPQTIQTMFLVGGAPAAAPAGTSAATAVARPPQTWIFIFDRQHLKPSGYRRAKTAAGAFMSERFREGDRAGILADERMVDNRLTGVRAEFLASLAKVKMPEESVQRDAAAIEAEFAGSEEAVEALRRFNAMGTLRAARGTVALLDTLARRLAMTAGPKTVVLFSDGFGINRLEEAVRATVGVMGRAGARVYSVDTRGMTGTANNALNTLGIDTGGMALFNVNNIGTALDTIAADTDTYYVLGYHSANPDQDGKYRSIEVRVKREGLRVRARRGYLALPGPAAAPSPR